jgi:hypothetical protein
MSFPFRFVGHETLHVTPNLEKDAETNQTELRSVQQPMISTQGCDTGDEENGNS